MACRWDWSLNPAGPGSAESTLSQIPWRCVTRSSDLKEALRRQESRRQQPSELSSSRHSFSVCGVGRRGGGGDCPPPHPIDVFRVTETSYASLGCFISQLADFYSVSATLPATNSPPHHHHPAPLHCSPDGTGYASVRLALFS